MGTVAGTKAKYPEACLIWIDAHADINTPESSDSGNLHGCPVSFLLGLEGTDVEPFNKWLSPCLKPEQLYVVMFIFTYQLRVADLAKRLYRIT